MSYEFKLEDPGEGIHEAEILEVLVKEGDSVEEGDNVLVAETDKAAVEIPSPVTGTVKSIKVGEGDIVNVGEVLMVFDENGETAEAAETEDEEAEAAETEDEEAEAAETEDEEAEAAETEDEEAEAAETEDEEAEAAETEDETEGKQKARKRKDKDRQEGEKEAKEKKQKRKKKEAKEDKEDRDREGPVPATPAVRRLARELGVDLADVTGSGEDGRVLEDDVRAAAKDEKEAGEKPGKTRRRERPALPDFEKWGEIERIELRSIRRAVANRMDLSWREIPHVIHQDEIDITELEQLRKAHYDEIGKRGGHLTLTPFFVKALVAALKEHPRFNSSLDPDAEQIILKHYYNIGVALDSDRGLLVPVLQDADKKSIAELAVGLTKLAEDVREGNASQDQLRGGTFSLTNIGSLGGTQFSPIINYPEAAIFGTARAQLKPVVKGDIENYEIEARLILPVCIAFDHRINDGADAARFMDTVKSVLSDPEEMILMG